MLANFSKTVTFLRRGESAGRNASELGFLEKLYSMISGVGVMICDSLSEPGKSFEESTCVTSVFLSYETCLWVNVASCFCCNFDVS